MNSKLNFKKIIYIKYGELTLKGKNRVNFIDCLYTNIKNALKEFDDVVITKSFDNMIISFSEKNHNEIIEILKRIPGIYQIINAYEISSTDLDRISEFIIDILKNKDFKTFKVITNRHDKSCPISSMDFSKQMGGKILSKIKNLKVLMDDPEIYLYFEIKQKQTIFYFEKINGFGGFPVGINGKILLMISGGIDSPVAASLLLKKGMHVDFLTFITPPHTSEKVLDKVKKLINLVTLDNKLEQPKLYVCNFTHIQHELAHISDKSYQITLMRRYFYRIANYLKNKEKYHAIATGESLGQVASQTIQSLTCISNVLDDQTQVLRPLLTYDKLDIIKLAKQVKTYETSIFPYEDCCTLFVPKSPVTKPSIDVAIKLEQELDLIDDIYKNVIKNNIEIIKEFNNS